MYPSIPGTECNSELFATLGAHFLGTFFPLPDRGSGFGSSPHNHLDFTAPQGEYIAWLKKFLQGQATEIIAGGQCFYY